MWHYYIYYRIDPTQTPAAQAAVQHVFRHVQDTLHIHGVLRRKCGEENLWMEIYEGITDCEKFESILSEAEQQSNVMNTLNTGERRHRECFID